MTGRLRERALTTFPSTMSGRRAALPGAAGSLASRQPPLTPDDSLTQSAVPRSVAGSPFRGSIFMGLMFPSWFLGGTSACRRAGPPGRWRGPGSGRSGWPRRASKRNGPKMAGCSPAPGCMRLTATGARSWPEHLRPGAERLPANKNAIRYDMFSCFSALTQDRVL